MSTKKKTIRKTEVEKENKKPPVLEDIPQTVDDNQEITTQREKELYEGQEHIEEISQEQLNQSNHSNPEVTENQSDNSKKEIINLKME